MISTVSPAFPWLGLKLAILGSTTKASAEYPVPAAVVTESWPDNPASGTLALIWPPMSSTLKEAGTPPKANWEAPSRPLPLTVIGSPACPEAGEKEEIPGRG